ncbi:MAG: hypothetical protein ABIG34_03605 [Candidatus Peregrinibacteria bacterium]
MGFYPERSEGFELALRQKPKGPLSSTNPLTCENSNSLTYSVRILFGYLLLGIAFLLLLTVIVTALGNIFVGVPFVPTSKQVSEEMIRFADLRGDETVYDLGAGDGRILITAKRLHPGIRAIGWEYVPTVWLLGKLRIWWSGQKITFRLGDSKKQNLHDADCLFLYLFGTVMPSLEERLNQELKPGTKVVSYVFPFPHRQPVAKKVVPWLGKTNMLWLYEW